MSATQKQIEALLAKLEPAVAKAFRDAIAQAKGRANIKQLEAAIQRGDIEAMMTAAGLTSGSFSNLQETIRNTYRMAGEFTAAADVPARLGFTFNMYNPRVQDWLSQRSSYLVTEITQTQRQAIQEVLQEGYTAGRNPRSVALDIVGRIDATGRRRGGVIGLHRSFAQAATTARTELVDLNPLYFQRMRRDRRFDKAIQRAIDTRKPLTETSINQIVDSYENRLLQLRGETIARTEVKMAFEASADESLLQVVDEGLTEADAVEKIWSATGDARTRPSHMSANGQRVKLNEPFLVAGYRMLYPGDPSAPASETINCRCIVTHKVDFSRVRV